MTVPLSQLQDGSVVRASSSPFASKKDAKSDAAMLALSQLEAMKKTDVHRGEELKPLGKEVAHILPLLGTMPLGAQLRAIAYARLPTEEQHAACQSILEVGTRTPKFSPNPSALTPNPQPPIAQVVRMIAAEHNATATVFGSFASGTADVESDLDISLTAAPSAAAAHSDPEVCALPWRWGLGIGDQEWGSGSRAQGFGGACGVLTLVVLAVAAGACAALSRCLGFVGDRT